MGAARVICSNYKFKVVAIVVMYCWLEYQVIVIAFKNKGLLHCNIILQRFSNLWQHHCRREAPATFICVAMVTDYNN